VAGECNRVGSDGLFVLDASEDSLVFAGVAARPVPSLFRGFSAPVKLSLDLSSEDLLVLLRHDADAFNRWQAAQIAAMRILTALSTGNSAASGDIEGLAEALRGFVAADAMRDPAFAALVLTMPSEADVAQEIAANVDPDAVHEARRTLRRRIGERCAEHLLALRAELAEADAYSPDAASAGRRALRNTALDLVAAADAETGERLASEQFASSTTMTDRLAALGVLCTLPGAAREDALLRFGERYENEPLVLDKWFAMQATIQEPETLARVTRLMDHPSFALTNPNRVRSLVGSFAMMNQTEFNRADGSGYAFLADMVLRIDPMNPQLAARLLTAFGTWRIMSEDRRREAERALRRIAENANISRDVGDIAHRSLG
jgi:aminopeptidase N